jgi:MFS family permease
LLGAHIAAAINWRAAFLFMGLAGMLLAPILLIVLRDRHPGAGSRATVPIAAVFPFLARTTAFWLISFAAALSSLTGYGLALWVPSVLMRSFGLNLLTTGNFLASLILVGGCAGVLGGGWLADRLGRADRGWYAWLPAIAWLISAPAYAIGLSATDLRLAWVLLLIANGLTILWLGPLNTAIQHLVSRERRASASASFLLINNLIGLGVGPLLIGSLSDALRSAYGADSLRYAAVACTLFYLVAAVLLLLSVKHLRASWIDDTADPTI